MKSGNLHIDEISSVRNEKSIFEKRPCLKESLGFQRIRGNLVGLTEALLLADAVILALGTQ